MQWYEFRSELQLISEAVNHPHVSEEHADWYSSVSFESTEIEYLDLIFGLIRAWKPSRILETGTRFGVSTAAIAFAAQENSGSNLKSILHTIESEQSWSIKAKQLIHKCRLSDYVTFHTGDSLKVIKDLSADLKFDFLFLDSSRKCRVHEFELLVALRLIADRCLIVVHDTSVLRSLSLREQDSSQSFFLRELEKIGNHSLQRMDFSLSRGLSLFRYEAKLL
jgi:predicted O-methyltransferase YrrM